jgi:glycosyltransferase involved in cell wall biosynthesis
MDAYYNKIFYNDINSIKYFYLKYPLFDINEYKKINKINIPELEKMNNIEILQHYHLYGYKNNLISSKKEFYQKYPDFDIIFYKDINKKLYCSNNELDYLINYINDNAKIYSINDFYQKYNVDMNFIKIFYNELSNKSEIEIIKHIYQDVYLNNFIKSDNDFNIKYPDFNIDIYSAFINYELENHIQIKSKWYNTKNENTIYSIKSFYKIYNDFNLNLYKFIYNETDIISFINKDKFNIIYSKETFKNIINDIDFHLMLKHYKIIIKFNKEQIIDYYIENIDKFKNIYSEKLFMIMNPNFNLEEYKRFNNINNGLMVYDKLIIYSDYNKLNNKNNIIISVNDFLYKNNILNIDLYIKILNSYNILFNNINEYIYYLHFNKEYLNIDNYINHFKQKYPTFNSKIYKYFNDVNDVNDVNNVNDVNDVNFMLNFDINKPNIIYSIESFYNYYNNFDMDIFKIFNNLSNDFSIEDLIIYFYEMYNDKLIYNVESAIKNLFNFNILIYKELNKDLSHLSNDKDLIIHWYKIGKYENRIYSKETFYKFYPNLDFSNNNNEINKIINWMKNDIYIELKKENIVGRNTVNYIYEVLLDFEYEKPLLKPGISLIIRAKNESLNIKYCIESVVDLVDEIIFVDNNSEDNTYDLVKEYQKIYDNIKLYRYNISVPKAGVEHKIAIDNGSKNTLGAFYNWCLSKATRYNVFKWDADFICIRNNFKQLVNLYNLRERDDKFAIWFTGKTIFENHDKFYINTKSFYDEFRIFSYKNNFCWYDGNTCEYTNPYLDKCNNKYKYIYPLFYEIKRTSIDEFKERSSLIDNRDIQDNNILNGLKNNNILDNLIFIDKNIINKDINIIIYTPALIFGGGNQFIINIYNNYKIFGFNVIIIPENYTKNETKNENQKFNIILDKDIVSKDNFNINFIKSFNPYCIFFNSNIPFKENEIKEISELSKIFFITHSDVAFSNSFIEKYHIYMSKIITVNNYTINKLSNKLNIEYNKFFKIINYININKNNNKNNNKNINRKFGVISRFSEDKNIPMLIYALKEVFKKYTNYKCYLIGTHNEYYDKYLKYLCKSLFIDNYIIFEGYQENVLKYYEMLDFIILPSVSEGCSYNIIEAMSIGLPVITSDVGGNNELIKNDINGILYEYDGIKEFEHKNIFIHNYNEQLSLIGYVKNNEYNYINNCEYKTEMIVPFYVNSIENIQKKEQIKEQIKEQKKEIFIKNTNKISESIIKMIKLYTNIDNINEIKKNNINFINEFFSEKIYINQLFNLLI